LIFPGVGAFETAIVNLTDKGLLEPLRKYIQDGKPYFGICIGMQVLFASSTESPGSPGLGIIPSSIDLFNKEEGKSIPHMGWNHTSFLVDDEEEQKREQSETGMSEGSAYYFVHSYRAPYDPSSEWAHTTCQYGSELFLSSVRKGNIFATQFHPEKSGDAGLKLLKAWMDAPIEAVDAHHASPRTERRKRVPKERDGFTKRIIACLDVRANDDGDLVVTKGDQYDVREKSDPSAPKSVSLSPSTRSTSPSRAVRNLGKPVSLAHTYFTSGADEICLLNITSFRSSPLQDQPMLAVVREAASQIFVPLTIGGGIKDTQDPDGTKRSALEVAGAYFRAGADKVSIGSEAVLAVEKARKRASENGREGEVDGDETSPMETIARVYGKQAVVVSADPKRVYVDSDTYDGPYKDEVVYGKTALSANEGERGKAWWYQCTISGGRELRDLSVVQLAKGVEKLGAGEILLNSIDRDGSSRGFDLDLVLLVKKAVRIPVVASSGAGTPDHFVEVFKKTGVEAGLAAGIFHRKEVEIREVKERCRESGIQIRK
jgi:glutamine amidotransferase/cyclase